MDLQAVTDRALWHVPPHVTLERNGVVVLLDPQAPNWVATDARGARILSWLDGRTTLEEVASRYAREPGVEPAKAWLHVDPLGPAPGRPHGGGAFLFRGGAAVLPPRRVRPHRARDPGARSGAPRPHQRGPLPGGGPEPSAGAEP